MRRRYVNLLLAAALVVALARFQTALRAPLPQLPAAPAVEATAPETAGPEAPEGESAAGATGDGYDAIAARDLFSATRGVIPPAPPSPAKPPPKPAIAPKLTLTGVVIVDGEKAAFLQEGPTEARPRKVREGDAFAGGTVKLIRPDGITFLFAGSEITVALRTPKDAGAPQRPGEPALPVQPPGGVSRRSLPAVPGQVVRPPQVIPGVPRPMPVPVQEEPISDEEFIDEGEFDPGLVDEEVLDEGEILDENEVPPEEFEEPAP